MPFTYEDEDYATQQLLELLVIFITNSSFVLQILRLQESLSKYEQSDDVSTPQVKYIHFYGNYHYKHSFEEHICFESYAYLGEKVILILIWL